MQRSCGGNILIEFQMQGRPVWLGWGEEQMKTKEGREAARDLGVRVRGTLEQWGAIEGM